MLNKKEIEKLFLKNQKRNPNEWDIELIKMGSRWTDIQWKHKMTEFKLQIKEIDTKGVSDLSYVEVWDLLEERAE